MIKIGKPHKNGVSIYDDEMPYYIMIFPISTDYGDGMQRYLYIYEDPFEHYSETLLIYELNARLNNIKPDLTYHKLMILKDE